MDVLILSAVAVAAYLLGSISPALIISHSALKEDVRKYGSGNAGATNMIRNYGWGYGILTFFLDGFKGALAVFLAKLVAGDPGMSVAAFFVVIGHNCPIYYGFRGGKGISTTLGVFLVMRPTFTLAIVAVGAVVIACTQIVSIGSILGLLAEAVTVLVFQDVTIYLRIVVLVLAVMGIVGHRSNIKRLLSGTENKIRSGGKKRDA